MNKHIFIVILLFCFIGSINNVCTAGLKDVSKIVITPSNQNTDGWLQVSEVIAEESGTGIDLALSSSGAIATASSSWPTSSPNYAIDSTAPASFPQIFHSYEKYGTSFLSIELASPAELDSVILFGRTGCCSSRDIYDIELFDVHGNSLFSVNDLNATSSSHSVNVTLPSTVTGSGNNLCIARLKDVSKIVIMPSNQNTAGWLQVSEVIAEESGTGIDLALSSSGATTTASSSWPASSPNYTIDSSAPASYPQIFHSSENNGSSFLSIELASPAELNSIKIFGRTDCCSSRDIYDIELFDVHGNSLFSVNDLNASNSSHVVSICLSNSTGSGDTAAASFNCVESGHDGISGNLYTKTTEQLFGFDVIALQDTSTIETSFANGADHTVSVELVDASSGTCSSYSSLSPSVSQNLLFTASDSGTKASAVMSSSTAYKNVKCRVTDNTDSPVVVGCSTDSFAIRPINFSITSNLTNSGFSSTPKVKTGENFTLTATATSGYNSIPEINNGKLEAHSGAILTGNIFGSFGSADSITGTATGTAFTYNEVGSLRFKAQGIYDDTFTAVDQGSDCTNDFSNTLVGDKVGCKFGNTSDSNFFGRFTPDHFDVTLNTPIFSTSCGSFTYIGQPVKYTTQPVASIAAKNSSDTTTQNYTGDFWKIDPTDNTYAPTYTEASHTLSSINDNPSVTDNGDGTGTLSFADTTSNILSINRNTPEAEFDAEIAMNFNLSDTDGIAVANVNGTPQSNPISFGTTSPGNGINFSSNKTQRWGRIVLNNAHGSELSVLAVPLQTEYFNGSDFILNTNDNCTSITLNSQILLSNPNTSSGTSQPGNTAMTIGSGTSSATLLNIPLSAGSANLNFSAPGAGNTGYIDINSDFSIFPWLLFDWDNNSSHDNSPSGKATFGIFKGNSNQIYFREVY